MLVLLHTKMAVISIACRTGLSHHIPSHASHPEIASLLSGGHRGLEPRAYLWRHRMISGQSFQNMRVLSTLRRPLPCIRFHGHVVCARCLHKAPTTIVPVSLGPIQSEIGSSPERDWRALVIVASAYSVRPLRLETMAKAPQGFRYFLTLSL